MRTDVHQHLWGPAFADALRRRNTAPCLDGWTLRLDHRAPQQIDPADHDLARRAAQAREDGFDRALTSLSAPLGVEWLPPDEAAPLLGAYHADALALPEPFGAWAAAGLAEIDAPALARRLDQGFAGLQLPATALLDQDGYERCAPLLNLLEQRGLPLFIHPGPVHPGPAGPEAGQAPAPWWDALVPYVQQMHAAWFALRAIGRPRHPRLRVCFALLAGLAPLHGERMAARGGGRGEIDRNAFAETSSYGPRTVDAVTRALGIDLIVCGSDRPYARTPRDFGLSDAAEHAIRTTNPQRLLTGEE